MKKYILCLGLLVVMIGALTACGRKVTTYTYENEAVLDIKIEKTEVYTNKLVVTFADDSLSEVESIVCYGEDFSIVEEQPPYSFRGNTLTVETQKADIISGMRVVEHDNLYLNVRYLDSDSYAMLVYCWADDVGYISSGDEDIYFTQEEKDEQEARAVALAEAEAATFNKLLGTWNNESGTVRIEFSYNEGNSDKMFTVYRLVDDEWVEDEVVFIALVQETEAFESVAITLYDDPYWGCAYGFYLLNDNTGMECNYSDEKFIRTDMKIGE